jgi:hypothetical protein
MGAIQGVDATDRRLPLKKARVADDPVVDGICNRANRRPTGKTCGSEVTTQDIGIKFAIS